MIGRLQGRLIEKEASNLVVSAGGVGYRVFVPLSTFTRIHGEDLDLFIHTEVRAESIQLFGFLSREERNLFRLLIGVQGVGPMTALAVLSGLSLDQLVAAIRASDTARLQGIPRIGKKTAERVCLELHEKVQAFGEQEGEAPLPNALPPDLQDALLALENLGYKTPKAKNALREAWEADPGGTLEGWLRYALKKLSP